MTKPRILLVEDEAILREHLAAQLSDEYVVDTAANGRQALRAVLRELPAMIVTDIVMPEIDGIELLKALRSTRRTQMIPVLLISGRALDEQRIEGFREGADGYLAKPYTERELRARIQGIVHSARLRNEAIRLETLVEAEKQANRRKSEFLAVLAHELRNPLAPLRNGLQILKSQLFADPTVSQTVNMMDRQITLLVRLVDDLLDMNRILRGRLALRRQKLLLREVLRNSVETSRGIIEAQRHELSVDLRASDLVVDGDPERLTQVFTNLLINSAKYTNPGGRIKLTVDRENDAAVVDVEDNGIGIPASEIQQVFEMFSQVRLNGARETDGLGIGLSLVRTLVEIHGGSVRAFSDGSGKGSRFQVRLPIIDEATGPPARSGSTAGA